MSIYATQWALQFPRFGDFHSGCEWVTVLAQAVPAHVGTHALPAHAAFLPPYPDAVANDLWALVFVVEGTAKGTERSGQEYATPLLTLSGKAYASMPFGALHAKLCDALRGDRPRLAAEVLLPGGRARLAFDDGSVTDALREELVRRWNERPYVEDDLVCYELNELGEWIVSPRPTPGHQHVASVVAFQLATQLGEHAVTGVSVYTDRGIRAPDVACMPAARWLEAKGQNPLPFVPDVCVEVVSPSNTRQEILMKVGAYLRGGAREAFVVGLKGEVECFGSGGRLEASALGIRLELPAELF